MDIPKTELEQIIYAEISYMLDIFRPLTDEDALFCAKKIMTRIKRKEKKYANLRPGIVGVDS